VRNLPNPWRVKAEGKVIRHLPITLYSDDTSGNKSKQWNKHISYYFTLVGLSPAHTNQEYNTHFLTTSNCATALEMAELVVDEMNEIATRGFTAYDSMLKSEVLVMSVVLCFLADSPMHAEATSTPYPGASNNPCRICKLGVMKREDKHTLKFVEEFFGLKSVEKRVWSQTKEQTRHLWELSKTGPVNEYTLKEKTYGVRDALNNTVMQLYKENSSESSHIGKIITANPSRIYNPFTRLHSFDGCQDTPVEILHVFLLGIVKCLFKDFMNKSKPHHGEIEAQLASFNTDALNIPPIQAHYMIAHYGSFVGKDYRVVLQVAPFILFRFMNDDQRLLWFELCYLGSLLFQTHIENLETYLQELETHIELFLLQVIKMSAQWANKHKFHMLIHLPFSIRRFGPPSLFATEKFESYNSILRTASIHSNRLSPSRDLAISFSNYQNMRLLLAGATLFDHKKSEYFSVSPEVTNIFRDNTLIQKSMGYNHQAINQGPTGPTVLNHKVPEGARQVIPQELSCMLPGVQFRQVISIKINSREVVRQGTYVMVSFSTSTQIY
jgi:hypothetical protein